MDLNRENIKKLTQVQQALLALPGGQRLSSIRSTIRQIADLVGARGGWIGCFLDGELVFVNEGVGPQIEEFVRNHFVGVDERGDFLFDDPELQRVSRDRRAMGSGIYADYEIYTDETRAHPQFAAVWGAANAEFVVGMSCRLPVGEALLGLAFESADNAQYRDRDTKDLLALLLPAFEAAFTQLYESGLSRDAYVALVEALPFPAIIRTRDGSLVAASVSITETGDWDDAKPAIRLDGPNFPGMQASEILFSPDDSGPDLLSLARSAGLSERRAEVAAALALGESNKEIARRFDISPNTVRHHCEAVFDQLGVTSRGGVMLALMNCGQGIK